MPPEFALTTDSIDDQRHVVAVTGEIDLFTAPELKSALGEALESGHTRIVVDLTSTTFLDSTALGVLIGAVKRLRSSTPIRTSPRRSRSRDSIRSSRSARRATRRSRRWTPTKPPPDAARPQVIRSSTASSIGPWIPGVSPSSATSGSACAIVLPSR
jgi:anti-anti-sigma regulatory factor